MNAMPDRHMDVTALGILQSDCVRRWHQQSIDNPVAERNSLAWHVCRQHAFNFRLWHEEDLARQPDASDAAVAKVKRNIDKLNQLRNDGIEVLDEQVDQLLRDASVHTDDNVPSNTETVGSAIDRLSIMSLRIYHYREEIGRRDPDADDVGPLRDRLQRCVDQHAQLVESLQHLVDRLFSGKVRHQTFRQFKMYNDPQLNPAIYGQADDAI
ncbi:MAG: DUF4254 domain-containing protein [Planctomycetota bacterium]